MCHLYDCLFPYQVNALIKLKPSKKKSEKNPSKNHQQKKLPYQKIVLIRSGLMSIPQMSISNEEIAKSEMCNAGGMVLADVGHAIFSGQTTRTRLQD